MRQNQAGSSCLSSLFSPMEKYRVKRVSQAHLANASSFLYGAGWRRQAECEKTFLGPLPLDLLWPAFCVPHFSKHRVYFLISENSAVSTASTMCIPAKAWEGSQFPRLIWLSGAPLFRHPSLHHPGIWTFSQRHPEKQVDTDSH